MRPQSNGELHEFISRRPIPLRSCRLYQRDWQKFTKNEKYVCVSGADPGKEIKEEKTVWVWIFGRYKTRKGCALIFTANVMESKPAGYRVQDPLEKWEELARKYCEKNSSPKTMVSEKRGKSTRGTTTSASSYFFEYNPFHRLKAHLQNQSGSLGIEFR